MSLAKPVRLLHCGCSLTVRNNLQKQNQWTVRIPAYNNLAMYLLMPFFHELLVRGPAEFRARQMAGRQEVELTLDFAPLVCGASDASLEWRASSRQICCHGVRQLLSTKSTNSYFPPFSVCNPKYVHALPLRCLDVVPSWQNLRDTACNGPVLVYLVRSWLEWARSGPQQFCYLG